MLSSSSTILYCIMAVVKSNAERLREWRKRQKELGLTFLQSAKRIMRNTKHKLGLTSTEKKIEIRKWRLSKQAQREKKRARQILDVSTGQDEIVGIIEIIDPASAASAGGGGTHGIVEQTALESLEYPNFRLMTSNRNCGGITMRRKDLSSLHTCICKPSGVDPCGPTSACMNRLMNIECHADLCASGEWCQNQRFVKAAQYAAPTTVFKTNQRGWGLKCNYCVYMGEFIVEYCGDVINNAEYKRRLQKQRGESNFYFYVLDKNRIIDGAKCGSTARFINHSCDPNCDSQIWLVNGENRVGIFAKVDIPPDTELTFDYNYYFVGLGKCQSVLAVFFML